MVHTPFAFYKIISAILYIFIIKVAKIIFNIGDYV